MIPKSEINRTERCYSCRKQFKDTVVQYSIWANCEKYSAYNPGGPFVSGKIVFHKECFREIAGEDWLLEGY